jgi:hypothetical protein
MGRKIALVIGNSEYDDASLARLITPSADVDDLAALLKSPEVGSFDEVLALVNEAATSVRKAVARLFKDKGPDDLLLLYFSGHGVLDDQGHLYLAVKDTERDLLSGTAIPANFITGEMDRSRSKRQVLVLDCCHSGAFARGSKGAVGASVGTASAFEGTGYGRVVLTATDATQYAWEGDQVIGRADNSVFTHFMIQGLQTGEADQDHDGRITLDELYDYVYAQVVAQTPRQTPGKWSYRQQGDMVIAKNPRPPVVKAAELPGELKQAIESPLANVREGAVRELDRLLRSSNAGLALAAQEALQHLAEDDSRRVSVAASDCLQAHAGQMHAQASQPAAWQKAENEEAARAKTEREPLAALAAAQLAARPVEQERPAKPQANAERVAAAGSVPLASVDAETQESVDAAAPLPAVVLRLLIVTGGWLAGWVGGILLASIIDSNLVTFLSLIAAWSIAGLMTGLILRRSTPSIQLYHILILIIVWTLVPLIGLLKQGAGSGDSYVTNLDLIAAVAITWLANSWFVLQMPPISMWWQALVVGAAGAIGWVAARTDPWNLVALRLSGNAWSLPAAFQDSGYKPASLLPNVILSGLLGGGALAVMYWLTQKVAARAPAPSGRAAPLETKRPTVLVTARQSLTNQQRTAILAGVIVSIGWFAGWLAGMVIGSLWNESSSGAISLSIGWIAAGVITGVVLRQVIHSPWWPILTLGAGWLLCLVLGAYYQAAWLLLAIAATWLINSLTAMLVVHNRIWWIAVLTAAAAGIAWIIVGTPWQLAALKFFGADYHWAMATLFASEKQIFPIDLLIGPAITAMVTGGILTFLLYRRAETPELP